RGGGYATAHRQLHGYRNGWTAPGIRHRGSVCPLADRRSCRWKLWPCERGASSLAYGAGVGGGGRWRSDPLRNRQTSLLLYNNDGSGVFLLQRTPDLSTPLPF